MNCFKQTGGLAAASLIAWKRPRRASVSGSDTGLEGSLAPSLTGCTRAMPAMQNSAR